MGAEMDSLNSVEWYFNEQDKDAPASTNIGELSMYVSRVADCVIGRWVWTGDLPDPDFENPRPAISGFKLSREAAIEEATAAAIQFAAGGLRVA